MKYDNGKTDLSLIPVEVLVDVADVLGFGAVKYGRDNHRLDGHKTEWSRTYASIQRHLVDFWSGQDIDPESGQKHITHAICQLIILATAINDGHTNMDDRYATRVKQLNTPKKLDGEIKDADKDDSKTLSLTLEQILAKGGLNEPTVTWSGTHIKPHDTAVTWSIGDNHTSLYYNNETGIINEYDATARRAFNADS